MLIQFLTATPQEINNNNIEDRSPYSSSIIDANNTRVSFPLSQLIFIQDFLSDERYKVTTDNNNICSIIIPSHLMIDNFFFKRLYHVQAFQYNAEMWLTMFENMKIVDPNNSHVKYTPIELATIVPLYDEDLKCIQRVHLNSKVTNQSINRTDLSQLNELKLRIQSKMRPNQYYFARLSTRSPKDTTQRDISHSDKSSQEQIANQYLKLKVNNASQIINLLINSNRVAYDIAAYFKFKTNGDVLNLVLRDWIEDIHHEYEFRCYVHEHQLTAISQYYCYDVFDVLQDEAHIREIVDSIMDFHKKSTDQIGYPSYVIDLLYNKEKKQISVIECNPHGSYMSSGSALFNWETDHDILYGTNTHTQYPVMRILKELHNDGNIILNV
jgi:hypothetical protein